MNLQELQEYQAEELFEAPLGAAPTTHGPHDARSWVSRSTKEVTTASDFRAAPSAAFVLERPCSFPHLDAGISGWIPPVHPSADDFDSFAAVLATSTRPQTKEHVILLDLRCVAELVALSAERAVTFSRDLHEAVRRMPTRIILIRGTHRSGGVVAAFYTLFKPYCRVEVVSEPVEALRSIGPNTDPAILEVFGVRNEIEMGTESAVYEKSPSYTVIAELRRLLEREPRSTLAEIASGLELSERTLQRRLAEAGTTLHNEVSQARLRHAQRRFVEGDVTIEQIAVEVGYASVAGFRRFFRRMTNTRPASWRARKLAPARES